MKQMSHELNEIFSNLEEGIVLLKNNTLNFANKSFIEIIKQGKIIDESVNTTS